MRKNTTKTVTTPVTPYLMRAYHEWMEDSNLTPYVLVDCTDARVSVPTQFIQQGKIVLNISTSATDALIIDNDAISFKARFEGKTQNIYVPTSTVLTIYAAENGEGMFFEKKPETEAIPEKKPTMKLVD